MTCEGLDGALEVVHFLQIVVVQPRDVYSLVGPFAPSLEVLLDFMMLVIPRLIALQFGVPRDVVSELLFDVESNEVGGLFERLKLLVGVLDSLGHSDRGKLVELGLRFVVAQSRGQSAGSVERTGILRHTRLRPYWRASWSPCLSAWTSG